MFAQKNHLFFIYLLSSQHLSVDIYSHVVLHHTTVHVHCLLGVFYLHITSNVLVLSKFCVVQGKLHRHDRPENRQISFYIHEFKTRVGPPPLHHPPSHFDCGHSDPRAHPSLFEGSSGWPGLCSTARSALATASGAPPACDRPGEKYRFFFLQ